MTMTSTTAAAPVLDDERADLIAQLAAARAALISTTAGLSDEQAGTRPTVSALCLGGLIKHVTAVEENWLRFVVGGPSAMGYDLPEGVTWQDLMNGTAREYPQWMLEHGAQFAMAPGETLAGIIADNERVAARAVEIVAGVEDLSFAQPLPEAPWNPPGEVRSVRRVLTQLVQEIARHAGHADILRESIDGHTAG